MTSKDIIAYIESPSFLNESTIVDLTLITEKYPYFQTAQLLRVKNLFNLDSNSIKPALNYTAAYVTDRKVLYYLLHPIKEEDKPKDLSVINEEEESVLFKGPEKIVKETIRENISDTIDDQLAYVQNNKEEAIEFGTTFDVKKEYGEGIKLDEYVIRISDNEPELLELFEDSQNSNDIEIKKPIELLNTGTANPDDKEEPQEEDILNLINKGVKSEEINLQSSEILNENQLKHNSIIDLFLKANPKIKPPGGEKEVAKDFSLDSVKENEHLITDTLASIYLKQGNYAKAIFAYEKLSLKYPEKNTYFAGQIAEIKKLIEKSK